jgi:hypothetical protein
LTIVFKGAMCGAAATVLGWLKSAKPGKFSWRGMLTKLPTGTVVGGLAAYYGMDFNSALTWAAGLGLVEAIDNGTKIIIRRVFPNWGYFEGNEVPDDFKYDPYTTSSLMKIVDGKDIDRDAVIEATEAFRKVYSKFLDLNDPQDKEFFDCLGFATNQILQNIRKQGWSDETFTDAGKTLFRMFQIYRKYRNNKTSLSAEEWAAEMKTIYELLKVVFQSGVSVL